MNELTSIGKVILGAVAGRPRSGYEIKHLVDSSTRFFWAASYGQIYPELARLEQAGLVEGTNEPRGGRKRRVFRPTVRGRAALRAWLLSDEVVHEVRDEGLLKLFFADVLAPEEALAVVHGLRTHRVAKREALREVEARAPALAGDLSYQLLCLDYGIGFNEWAIEWCDRVIARLEAGARKEATT